MRDPLAPLGLQLRPCPACGGDGYTLSWGHGGNRTDAYADPYAEPYGEGRCDEGEEVVACGLCSGFGELEVCASCAQVPTLEGGLEVCGCAAIEVAETLPRAA